MGTKAKRAEKQDMMNSFEAKLIEEGINFYARGNESFWSLEMNFEGNYPHKTLNGEEIYTPNLRGEIACMTTLPDFMQMLKRAL